MKNDMAKEKLLEEKQLLEEELRALGRYNPDTKKWEATPEADAVEESDDNDLADRFEDFEDRSAKLEELGARFATIESALGRIDDGSYGVCRVCEKEIEPSRLDANPAADTCIEHKEM